LHPRTGGTIQTQNCIQVWRGMTKLKQSDNRDS